MSVLAIKITAFFVVFITGLLGGLLSKRLSGSKKSELLYDFIRLF